MSKSMITTIIIALIVIGVGFFVWQQVFKKPTNQLIPPNEISGMSNAEKVTETLVFENVNKAQTTMDGIVVTTKGILRQEFIGKDEISSTAFTFSLKGKQKEIIFTYPNLTAEWEGYTFTMTKEFPITLVILKN